MLPTVSYYITFVPIIAVKNSCSGISDIMHDPNCNKHPIQHNYGWHVVKSLLGGLKQCSTDETTFINPYIQWCLCVLTHGIRGVLVGCLTTEMPNICSRNFDYDRGVSKKTSQRFLFCLSFILPFLRKKKYINCDIVSVCSAMTLSVVLTLPPSQPKFIFMLLWFSSYVNGDRSWSRGELSVI